MVKISDLMRPGQTWRSEWGIDWSVISVSENYAEVKRLGGRSIHTVTLREVENWERV